MNGGTFFITTNHSIRRAYRGIVFGGMVIGMSALLFTGQMSVANGEDPFTTSDPLVPSESYSYTLPDATPEQVGPTVQSATRANPSTAAPAAPAANSIYVTRYLPDILQGAQGPADMVFLIYQYLMGLVGVMAVCVIMYGGILRTVSADPSKIRQSNDYIKNALKGIVLLFGAQVLFNTINPNIVDIQRIQRALQPPKRIVAGPLANTEAGF